MKQELCLSKLSDEAARLAELGYKVFPCRAGAKTPATAHGVKDATTDIQTIAAWFDDNATANLAIATDGLVVVDVDGAQNPWLTPERALELATGAVTMTPRGGRHFWFRAPDGVDVRCSASQIAKNVDIRATGGYVLVPPSRTAHGAYAYVEDCELTARPDMLPEPPGWLLDAIFKRDAKTHAREDVIPAGARNNTLTSVAGRLRRVGLEREEIEAVLQHHNEAHCLPPLAREEVARIAQSVSRYAPAPAPASGAASEVLTLGELINRYPRLDAPVVDGLARFGEVVNVISKSKVGKSWLVYSLALSIACGRSWLERFACSKSRVLVIDTELKRNVLASRIPAVAAALGLEADEYESQVDIVTLRGSGKTIFDLQELLNSSARGRYGAVIIDALYKLIPPDASENDNAAVAAIYAALDAYAEATGAALFVVHHATKGSQSDKDVTDVGAGAGAQSRAADTHLVLRPHEQDGCVVLDAAVRSFAPISPLALRWAFPCWTPDHSLAPDALRGTKRARESESASRRFEEKRQKVLDFLARPEIREHGASFTTIRDGAGISNALLAVLNSLADAGLVETLESSHARTRKSIRKWRLSEMPDAGYRIDFRLNPVSGKNAGYRINPYI